MSGMIRSLDSVLTEGAGLELFKFSLSLALLLITWTLGRWLLLKWEDKKSIREQERDRAVEERRRLSEISRDMRRQFHNLFGDFKSNVRMWRILGMPTESTEAPDLLERIVRAEGMVEALVSDIATFKMLNQQEVTTLGLFRQGYQTLRQAFAQEHKDRSKTRKEERTEKVPAEYDTAPYHLFHDAATRVSRIIVEVREEPEPGLAQKNFDGVIDVRSDVWELALSDMKGGKSWGQIIEAATKKRNEGLVRA